MATSVCCIKQIFSIRFRFSPALQLSVTDRKTLEVTELGWGLQQAVFSISNATSHTSVLAALQRLTMYLTVVQGTPHVDVVNQLQWFQAMERYEEHFIVINFHLWSLKLAFDGARCSSVVRAFAHGAMGRRIDPSWGGPIELFLVPASAP